MERILTSKLGCQVPSNRVIDTLMTGERMVKVRYRLSLSYMTQTWSVEVIAMMD